jgi:hypothetical protein
MKRIYHSVILLASVFSLTMFQSCKKHMDCKEEEEPKDCAISKVIILRNLYNDTATFLYNAMGNPTAINVTNVATGNPNYVFKYDAMNRLSQFIGVYENGFTENWVMYTYGPDNRVVVDTTYTFAAYNGGTHPTGYWGLRISHYTYDAMGRITRVDTDALLPAPAYSYTTHYNYDAEGNLIRPGVVYDDKMNFRLTNEIWQLVDKNYSQNNPLPAVSYNPDLPLSFRSGFAFTHNFLSFPINQSDFIYNCTSSSPKGFKY